MHFFSRSRTMIYSTMCNNNIYKKCISCIQCECKYFFLLEFLSVYAFVSIFFSWKVLCFFIVKATVVCWIENEFKLLNTRASRRIEESVLYENFCDTYEKLCFKLNKLWKIIKWALLSQSYNVIAVAKIHKFSTLPFYAFTFMNNTKVENCTNMKIEKPANPQMEITFTKNYKLYSHRIKLTLKNFLKLTFFINFKLFF